LFKQAAENGFVESQYHLGMCYSLGIGVKKDMITAKKWLDLAASNGFTPPDSNSLGDIWHGIEQNNNN